MMVQVDDVAVDVDRIVTVKMDNQFYMNGSVSTLVVHLDSGAVIRREHSRWFNAHAAHDQIKKAKGLC